MQPIKEEASWTCTMSCAKQEVGSRRSTSCLEGRELKEAHVPVQPASPRPSQLMVELWCVLENFSCDLLMLRLSLQGLSLLMLAS